MRIVFFLSLFFFLFNCSSPKTVFICGDHVCVNKTEAEQYFEENFILEVKIIDRKKPEKLNLVQLNLMNKNEDKKEVQVITKPKIKKELKNLSEKEKKKIKKDVIEKKLTKKKKIKINKKFKNTDIKDIKNEKKLNKAVKIKKHEQPDKSSLAVEKFNICSILEKCNIDEISDYLIKIGKNKEYPDITRR